IIDRKVTVVASQAGSSGRIFVIDRLLFPGKIDLRMADADNASTIRNSIEFSVSPSPRGIQARGNMPKPRHPLTLTRLQQGGPALSRAHPFIISSPIDLCGLVFA